jgi:hypothetical protein
LPSFGPAFRPVGSFDGDGDGGVGVGTVVAGVHAVVVVAERGGGVDNDGGGGWEALTTVVDHST